VLDSGEIEVKTKNGLKPLNQDGTKSITFDELIDSHLSELQVVKQSNAGTAAPQGQAPKAASPEAPKFNLPHLQKAQENAQRLQSMKVFGKE